MLDLYLAGGVEFGFLVSGGILWFLGCCSMRFGCLVFIVGGIGFWFLMHYLC